MNEREKFLFDLQGFLVIKNVLTPEEVHKLNISVDKKNCGNCVKTPWWKFWAKKKKCFNAKS